MGGGQRGGKCTEGREMNRECEMLNGKARENHRHVNFTEELLSRTRVRHGAGNASDSTKE
jgi:hypothetical protein